MSSFPLKNIILDTVDQAGQEKEPVSQSTSAATPSQAIPQPASHCDYADKVDRPPSSIIIIEHFDNDDGSPEATSPQSTSSPNETPLDEKAQKIRIIVPKTQDSNVDNLATATTKGGTPTSKAFLFSPTITATAEKLRLRTSPVDPTSEIAQWGIDWYQPSAMLGLFIIGLVGMICHHVYNYCMNGRVVGDPQWPQRFGSAFSFFAKMCMVGAANIAYKQLVWVSVQNIEKNT